MQSIPFKDRAQEWLRMNRTLLIQMGVVVCICIIVGAIMIPDIATTKGEHATAMDRMDQGFSAIGSEVADLAGDVNAVASDLAGVETELGTVSVTITEHGTNINTLDSRVGATQTKLTKVEADLAAVQASPPEGWLTGSFGTYTVHAKASKAGTFTASVYLCYSPMVGLSGATYGEAADEFYAALNTSATSFKAYVPTLSYNGTAWGVTGVAFNIGTFTLEAKAEETISAVHGGLPEAYKPDWAYTDVWVVLKD